MMMYQNGSYTNAFEDAELIVLLQTLPDFYQCFLGVHL